MTTRHDIAFSQKYFSKVTLVLAMLLMAYSGNISAQKGERNLLLVENSLQVNSTVDEAWKILSDFASVGSFHVLYDETRILNGSTENLAIGIERESLMPDGMYNVILKERVVDLVEGKQFTFEILESDKPSMESMQITYGVETDKRGQVRIYNRISYVEGSKVWRSLVKRKHDRDSKMSLISYKFHIETGKTEKDVKRLKEWFEFKEQKRDQIYLATTDVELN